MTDAVNEVSPMDATPTPNQSALRTARVLRAAVLLAVGLVIAFTATLHENLEANRWTLAAAFALLGLTTLFEYLAQHSDRASWPIAVRAALMLVAAAAMLVSRDQTGIALAIAVWAVANAVLVLLPTARRPESRRHALPAALLGFALAVVVLMLREDPVAVIGFFGAYAVISGVFLGISAFDGRGERSDAKRIAPRATAS